MSCECCPPSRTPCRHEGPNRFIEIKERDLEALKLQIGELQAKLKDSEGDHRQIHGLQLRNDTMRKALEKIRDHEGPGLDGSPPTILYDVAVSALSVGLEKRNHDRQGECCCQPVTKTLKEFCPGCPVHAEHPKHED